MKNTITRNEMKYWVIDALKSMGGKGWPKDVAKYIWHKHEQELRGSESLLYTWQYDLRWAAQMLRSEGTMKAVNGRTDLPRELT